MAVPSTLYGSVWIQTLACASFTPPAGCVVDASIPVNANITANKVTRHESINTDMGFTPTTTIVAATKTLHIVRGSTGSVVAIQASITGTIATGSDRTVTIDLQKSTGGGAFASILASTFQLTHTSTLYIPVSGTIATPGLVAGDILEMIVTVAGSSSAQALGLQVTVTTEETEN